MRYFFPRACVTAVLLGLAMATAIAGGATLPLSRPVCRSVDGSRILEHARTLASDEFEGRGPGSAGEEKTVRYLEAEFARSGLKPGMPGGSWMQEVPIVGITSTVEAAWTGPAGRRPLIFPQDLVAWSPVTNSRVAIPSGEMVFVGYGVTAPEYRWDDYKDVDVHGKTVVILVNDPPVPGPKSPGSLDPRTFQGNAMTYYGRWTYKYEEAARRGAAAALLIHETRAAAYPWFVVVNSWGRERFELVADADPKTPLAGWISQEAAKELLALNGMTYESALALAVQRSFRPVILQQRFEASVCQSIRRVQSRNVVGVLPGSDPVLRNQYVVYSAHWDHLGRDAKREGDQIFNGAADNAVGVAGLLELARSFGAVPKAPKRSVVFFAPTAEEQGLLGARYFARNPSFNLASAVANLNMDGLNTWGRTRDLRQVGAGHSTLDDVLQSVARSAGRRLMPDPHPERGMFFRSDHFEFMKLGVPAVYLKAGDDYLDHPAGYGERRVTEYIENDYHKVSDEVKPGWDLRGAEEDIRFLAEVGWRLADGRDWPQWRSGSEFRTKTRRGATTRNR